MADIFISYSKAERDQAARLAGMLGMEGYSVWWDTDLDPGDNYTEIIRNELDNASVVVVIWTPAATKSEWVLSEAKRAHACKKLIQVTASGVKLRDIPHPFDILHVVDLDEFGAIVKAIDKLLDLVGLSQIHQSGGTRSDDSFMPVPQIDQGLRAYFKTLNITIDKLTEEQINAFYAWRNERHIVVKGCAGSGKTLVALDVASKLAHARFRVGFFCHSPILTKHVEKALAPHPLCEVHYFYEYVAKLAQTHQASSYVDWAMYEEPTEEEVIAALLELETRGARNGGYDAVIVDEGQDFRKDWLELLGYSLRQKESGFYYVFLDEKQAFVDRGTLELSGQPISLSRNARNAGKVFEVVKQFHPMAPPESPFLRNEGVSRITKFQAGGERDALEGALRRVNADLGLAGAVVLTAEHGPLSNATILKQSYDISGVVSWQKISLAVMEHFAKLAVQDIKERFPYDADIPSHAVKTRTEKLDQLRSLNLPSLSPGRRPELDSIRKIKAFGAAILQICERFVPDSCPHVELDFNNSEEAPIFIRSGLRMDYGSGRQRPTSGRCGLNSLDFENCTYLVHKKGGATIAPAPVFIQLKPYWLASGRPGEVAVYKVEQYKGLEADAVVLFVPQPMNEIDRVLYVGASRARGYLEILMTASAFAKTGRLRT